MSKFYSMKNVTEVREYLDGDCVVMDMDDGATLYVAECTAGCAAIQPDDDMGVSLVNVSPSITRLADEFRYECSYMCQ